MKSYTDLEQSKVLAGILPPESADGYWSKGFPAQPYMVYTKGTPNPGEHIPCWSLSALFNVIPQEILDGEYILNITEGREDIWVLTYNHYENKNHLYFGLFVGADNLIDVCYKMIIRLNELNSL